MPKKTVKRPSLFKSFKVSLFNKLLKNKHLKNSITLEHRTIYVLPSSLGWYFVIVAILNFVMGINYQNNLILIMSYLMFVVIIIAVLMGYSNAKGLTVKFKDAFNSYSPQKPNIRFELQSPSVTQSINLTYQGTEQTQQHTDEVDSKTQLLTLNLPYSSRGKYAVQRIKIASNYPFGLITVWSYIQLQTDIFVYPSLEQVLSDTHTSMLDEQADKGISKESGSEEFESLIPHLPEMGLQRISWKHYAKTQQLLVKEFADFKTANALFDFTLMNGDTEQRLSQLCFLVCEATEQNTPFMLKLPSKTINTNTGLQHKQQCLALLCSFNGGV
ncbi:DUF58 domain-containing protein [Pseudoalteromonas sp. SWN29]|uniref:DUF58 domain-containing protein n=1 Tax=Pseudoalteromonas sp. SWN29 TaxID=2792064 RepID=UPI0018CE0D60|nr:DUF58 domain-containing protein [Pseudoalteromonas sp. SWN29]MBH0027407.1 DUF58 domain-containing protein [Pseudoalteromonas sp. SWN29]